MKALIAGAGIGGLTTALFLHRAGIEVEVFERARSSGRNCAVSRRGRTHRSSASTGAGCLVSSTRLSSIGWGRMRSGRVARGYASLAGFAPNSPSATASEDT
ncbi:NAD(P)-binding protein [Shinella sp. S4-D37]|uniref:NAD(P)-binding protein n=1 Tax=Shinella sp. S4-D37 TaxID=3161999 RepID=UPI003467D088